MSHSSFDFVRHRTFKVGSEVGVFAVDTTAWAILPQSHYDWLQAHLPMGVSELLPAPIQSLWDAGLMSRDGAVNPSTLRARSKAPNSILVKMTGACDYICTYCYDFEPSRWSAKLSTEQIVAAVDGLIGRTDALSVVFHGGEPLLRFRTIVEVVERIREHERGHLVRFAIQTNGSRLSDEIVQFLDRHNFSVGLSLDGHTEEANRHRIVRNGPSALERIAGFVERWPDFVRRRCGVVAVVSQSSVAALPDFALWLQDKGINGLSLSYLDAEGRGGSMGAERLSPSDAVDVYGKLLALVRSGAINDLAIRTLLSRISNLFTFQPTDFCHKGPCAAADDFIVLDAENRRRTCDCIYDSYFEIDRKEEDGFDPRAAVIERHEWLKEQGPSCATCALFGLCGGTCVAKAISVNGSDRSVDPTGCAVVRFLYPELLRDFLADPDGPIFRYYRRHRGVLNEPQIVGA